MLVIDLIVFVSRLEDGIARGNDLADVSGAVSVVRCTELVQSEDVAPDLMVRVLVFAEDQFRLHKR